VGFFSKLDANITSPTNERSSKRHCLQFITRLLLCNLWFSWGLKNHVHLKNLSGFVNSALPLQYKVAHWISLLFYIRLSVNNITQACICWQFKLPHHAVIPPTHTTTLLGCAPPTVGYVIIIMNTRVAGSLKSICKARVGLEIIRFTWTYKTADISAYVDLRVKQNKNLVDWSSKAVKVDKKGTAICLLVEESHT